MKVVLASVTAARPLTTQMRFLSLGYIHASALSDDRVRRRADIVHEYYDPEAMQLIEIADAIAALKPDVVGFTCYTWTAPDNFKLCLELRRRLPKLTIILGGPEVSYHYTRVLEQQTSVDFIAVGEGEHTFREFLAALVEDRQQDLATIAGLAQRKNGKPFLPRERGYEKQLDKFPSPYLSGVLDVCEIRGGVNYQTVRGCPFVCTFCDYGRNQPYYEFSLDRVSAEFELFKAHGARALFNTDPTFNYRRNRAEEILQVAIDLDMKAVHWFEVFPSLVDESFVELLKKSHLTFLGCGIQTSSPETMRNIRRVWNPDRVARVMDELSGRQNVILSYEIIMGLPGDTVKQFKDSMSWAYERQPSDIKSFNLAILPRTPLEEEVEKWGIEYDENMYHEVRSTGTMTRHEVMVGRAMNDWHSLMKSVLLRLYRVLRIPAGDFVERWAWKVYNAGYDEQVIHSMHRHKLSCALVEALADLWEEFVADLCAECGVIDLSSQFREFLRYHYYRLSRTWIGVFYPDARDIVFHEPYAAVHRVFSATAKDLVARNGSMSSIVPKLGAPIVERQFRYDMEELFPLTDTEDIAVLEPRNTDYVFFMTPSTGAGCAIRVDDATRSFLARVDGVRSLAEISEDLESVSSYRIYETLRPTGIFDELRCQSMAP